MHVTAKSNESYFAFGKLSQGIDLDSLQKKFKAEVESITVFIDHVLNDYTLDIRCTTRCTSYIKGKIS